MDVGRPPNDEDAETLQSAALWAGALNEIRDGVATLRPSGGSAGPRFRWALINRAAEALLGCRAETLLGRCLDEMPCHLPAGLLERLAMLLDRGEAFETEHVVEATGRDLRIRASMLQGEVLLVLEDQTPQSRAENSASELVNNLAFVLRAPVTTVIGVSEILQEGHVGPLTDRQRQYLGDINAAGRRLLAVVNDVLDLSRIEAGHAELNLESLDVGNLVRSALAIFGQRASDKDLRLTAQLPEGVALLLADERKLKQMLYNYLDNAVKFTPEGGSVWVRVEDAEGELHFEVQDNGLGIARADLPKLFRPFAPLDGSASRRFEGTGLGLSLVKLLAELHGGRVWVKSEPGRGSTFGFSVPTNLSA